MRGLVLRASTQADWGYPHPSRSRWSLVLRRELWVGPDWLLSLPALVNADNRPITGHLLEDKFGVSWQIIPSILGKGLQDKDPARAKRVMQAMLGMRKLDVAELERAYNG